MLASISISEGQELLHRVADIDLLSDHLLGIMIYKIRSITNNEASRDLIAPRIAVRPLKRKRLTKGDSAP